MKKLLFIGVITLLLLGLSGCSEMRVEEEQVSLEDMTPMEVVEQDGLLQKDRQSTPKVIDSSAREEETPVKEEVDPKTISNSEGTMTVTITSTGRCIHHYSVYKYNWFEKILNVEGKRLSQEQQDMLKNAIIISKKQIYSTGEEYDIALKKKNDANAYIQRNKKYLGTDMCFSFRVTATNPFSEGALWGTGYNQYLTEELNVAYEPIKSYGLDMLTTQSYILKLDEPTEDYDFIYVTLIAGIGGSLPCLETNSCTPKDEIKRENTFTFKVYKEEMPQGKFRISPRPIQVDKEVYRHKGGIQ